MKKGAISLTFETVIILIVAIIGLAILALFVFETAKGGVSLTEQISQSVCEAFKKAAGVFGWFTDCS